MVTARSTAPVSLKRKQETEGGPVSCASGEYGRDGSAVMLVVSLFTMHEPVGVRPEVVTHAGMVVQIFVKAPMAIDELLIVDQRRIFPQFPCDVGMLVEIAPVRVRGRRTHWHLRQYRPRHRQCQRRCRKNHHSSFHFHGPPPAKLVRQYFVTGFTNRPTRQQKSDLHAMPR